MRMDHELEQKITARLTGVAATLARRLFADPEIEALQNHANTVSIVRLKYNDHGPVHMRKVLLNAMVMFDLLADAKVTFSLEEETVGTMEDSRVAVILAAFLHDIGMSIGRDNHEENSALLAKSIIDRHLEELFPDDVRRRVVIRSTALESIVGHMATHKTTSVESGIILIADGCDMEKGRARIPMIVHPEPRVGDIHKHSAAAIHRVKIEAGSERPIRITVTMDSTVGYFQIEEVLYRKIESSSIRRHLELYAGLRGEELKRYL
jgi:uncharacterized protein